MKILKVTKNQGFTFCLEDTFFEKPRREGVKLTLPSRFRVKQHVLNTKCCVDKSINKKMIRIT